MYRGRPESNPADTQIRVDDQAAVFELQAFKFNGQKLQLDQNSEVVLNAGSESKEKPSCEAPITSTSVPRLMTPLSERRTDGRKRSPL